MTFTVNSVKHEQTIYLDKTKQLERSDAPGGTTQIQQPGSTGCTYSVYGGGAGCSSWVASSKVGDPVNMDEMTCGGATETVDGVLCDKCTGIHSYNASVWFKQGTNELVASFSDDDLKAGTDGGMKHYSSWSTAVDPSVFVVESSWHCTGPSQCTGGSSGALGTNSATTAAPALPDAYSFVQTFGVSGAQHKQTVYLNKPKQLLRLDGNSGPGTIQLNRPQAQGCTYNIYGAGGSAPGCSSWAATSKVGDMIHTDQMACDGTTETVDGVTCDKCTGVGGYDAAVWFKKGTNELVQTFSADDQRAGTDGGLKHYSSWSSAVADAVFDVEAAWHCTGPSQCLADVATQR